MKNSKPFIFPLLLLLIWGYFLICLPNYFQGGDTAELVAAGEKLLVAHPPGYPLWIWLEHAWLTVIPFGTVFWRAALLTSVCALATLFWIGRPLRRTPSLMIYLILTLAASTCFLQAAVLPDVFALNALLTALIGSIFLFRSERDYKSLGLVPFIFLLGLAHHQTLVFLAPSVALVGFEALQARQIKTFILGTLAGLVAVTALYASLMLMHPESPYSWGVVSDFSKVAAHFLREDYGTFQLTAQAKGGPFESIVFFLEQSAFTLVLLALPIFWALAQSAKVLTRDSRFWLWTLSTLASIGFFFLMKVSPSALGSEIL